VLNAVEEKGESESANTSNSASAVPALEDLTFFYLLRTFKNYVAKQNCFVSISPETTIAAILQVSPETVRRWVKEANTPTVETQFKVIGRILAAIERIKSIRKASANESIAEQAQRELQLVPADQLAENMQRDVSSSIATLFDFDAERRERRKAELESRTVGEVVNEIVDEVSANIDKITDEEIEKVLNEEIGDGEVRTDEVVTEDNVADLFSNNPDSTD
jgi:hypothetical protein